MTLIRINNIIKLHKQAASLKAKSEQAKLKKKNK